MKKLIGGKGVNQTQVDLISKPVCSTKHFSRILFMFLKQKLIWPVEIKNDCVDYKIAIFNSTQFHSFKGKNIFHLQLIALPFGMSILCVKVYSNILTFFII